MRFIVTLVAVMGLTLAVEAQAIGVPAYPNSLHPVWLSSDLIRFDSNIATGEWTGQPFVVAPDGSGLRLATAAEAAAQPAAAPAGETVKYDGLRGLVFHDGNGHQRVLDADVREEDGNVAASLSPDGRFVAFSETVGALYYHSASTVYVMPVDGSAEPTRLTPTPCTPEPAYPAIDLTHCFDGTDGRDHVVGTKAGDLIITGSGDDVVRAGDGQNHIQTQWGNDDIRSGSGQDYIYAGPGNDVIRSGAGADRISTGGGHDVVFAGAGDDHIWANDGDRDVIDCGPGDDTVIADAVDVLRNCEHVLRDTARAAPIWEH